MKKKRCPVYQSFKSHADAWSESNQKLKQGKELTKPAFCMYLYEQCNKRGAPKKIALLMQLFVVVL